MTRPLPPCSFFGTKLLFNLDQRPRKKRMRHEKRQLLASNPRKWTFARPSINPFDPVKLALLLSLFFFQFSTNFIFAFSCWFWVKCFRALV